MKQLTDSLSSESEEERLSSKYAKKRKVSSKEFKVAKLRKVSKHKKHEKSESESESDSKSEEQELDSDSDSNNSASSSSSEEEKVEEVPKKKSSSVKHKMTSWDGNKAKKAKKDTQDDSQVNLTKAKKDIKCKDTVVKETVEKEDITEGLRAIEGGGRISLEIGQFKKLMAFVQ